jgi:hypothetical protein
MLISSLISSISTLSSLSPLSSLSSSSFGEEENGGGGGEEHESDLTSVPTVNIIWIRILVRTNKYSIKNLMI